MSKKIQAIRGMHDILPNETSLWQSMESRIRAVFDQYGYREIRLPIVEQTALFKRSIGEVTDIVEKEMYTFEDRNGDSLTLRPEGTACCVRAGMEHGLLHNQVQRLWYQGPMFRHERPQKGRYRQFHQFGVECFGIPGAAIDAEMILMTRRMWRALGLEQSVQLQLNSLGTPDERQAYRDRLVDYFSQHLDQLDEDSQRRLHSNPLRILDSKNPSMQALNAAAPSLLDVLGEESRSHFERLKWLLDEAGLPYQVNPRLVRGLDYYCHTVFEWVTDELGAQGTVCAGGRYDGLVEQLGGRATPATGFALGMERLVLMLQQRAQEEVLPEVYLVSQTPAAEACAFRLAESLRDQIPGLQVIVHCGGGSLKSQFKRADKSGARLALIVGEEELEKNLVGIKFLREDQRQQQVGQSEIADFILQLNAQ